ncbi:MAG: transporter [Verrucomicrobiales bacterium]
MRGQARVPIKTLLAAVLVTACGRTHAQDMEPRAYSNSPTGLNFAIAGYAYSEGDILTDPALPIEDVTIEYHTGIFALATTLDVLDKSAKLDMILSYSSLDATGLVAGVERGRLVSGFSDPLFRFSINFIGAPALTMEEFASYKQDWIVGASLRVGMPLGHYDEDKLINLGSNRWSLRPEIGVSKAFGRWTAELAPGVTFYTDNGDFLNGRTREQAPLFATQASLSYVFAPSLWMSVSGSYFVGGRSTVDGKENNDEQEGGRLGLTVVFPVNRHNSVKLFALRGFAPNFDSNLDVIGLAWQYRWGGGF